MSSFIAAGTAYSTLGVNTIPFFTFYSMFGFQRIGDLIWAAGDMKCKGFLVGATAGRTTLAGEGLQHQDGHSHLLARSVPNVRSYDPAFAYELAIIIKDGLRRMYVENEDGFYYLTVTNDKYVMPAMPAGVTEEAIIKGLYKFRAAPKPGAIKAHLWGSGAILNEALKAQEKLADYGVAADVWSVTSYNELYRDALAADRHNMLQPSRPAQIPYVAQAMKGEEGVIVAASDNVATLPDSLARWLPLPLHSLGTDGFGLSEDRARLRNHFEVDARFITLDTLVALARADKIAEKTVQNAIKDLEIDTNKPDPATYLGKPALKSKE
jgi:pyruvate dehydrogenase E1 component